MAEATQQATSQQTTQQATQQTSQQQAQQTQQTQQTTQTQEAWPTNWRERLAGGDAEHLKTLARFQDPTGIWKSYAELRSQRDSGKLKMVEPFPDKGTPEQQTAWRKENGIPDKPEAYDTNLEGVVIGDNDKPMVESFAKYAHGRNMSQAAVKDVLQWYFGPYTKEIQEAQSTLDAESRAQGDEILREQWGPDYKRNLNAVQQFLATAPEKVRGALLGARFEDGRALGNDPDVARWFAEVQLQLNPHTTLVPGTGAQQVQAIDTEIAAIEKRMREDRKGYNRDEKQQARYRDLLTARESMKGKQRVA